MGTVFQIARMIFIYPYFALGPAYLMYVLFKAAKNIYNVHFWRDVIKIFFACNIFVFVSFLDAGYIRKFGVSSDPTSIAGLVFFAFAFYAVAAFVVSFFAMLFIKIVSVVLIRSRKSQKSPESQNPHPQQ